MTTEELMIRDLVKQCNSVVEVVAIKPYSDTELVLKDGNRLYDAHIGDIDPIPLTEEIILKNGGEDVTNVYGNPESGFSRIYSIGNVMLGDMGEFGIAWLIEYHDSDHGTMFETVSFVHHVHQMQHIFTMTGIRKKLVV